MRFVLKVQALTESLAVVEELLPEAGHRLVVEHDELADDLGHLLLVDVAAFKTVWRTNAISISNVFKLGQ